jgi:hypothetical protein
VHTLVDREIGIKFPTRMRFFLYSIMSRQALEHTQPSVQWVPKAVSLENEAEHSPSFSTEIKNM